MTQIDNNNRLTNKPTVANSFAASLMGDYDKDHATWESAFVDHAEFASQMVTATGGNKFVSRKQYRLKNWVNGLFVELYGNEIMPPEIEAQRDPNAKLRMYMQFMQNLPLQERYGNEKTGSPRWSARLNVMYHEARRDKFLHDNPFCDSKHDEYSSVEAANNLEWNDIKADLHEARLNKKEVEAAYRMYKNQYEKLSGEEYLFQPWNPTSTRTVQATASKARLGASLPDAA